MANESMTNERAEQFYFTKYPEHAAEGGSLLDHDAIELMAAYAESELARVRGPLQRQWISVQERISAAKDADWMQVVGNGGPPCFHYEADRRRFCLRAERWFGHAAQPTDVDHKFVSLADLLQATFPQSPELVPQGAESADIGKLDDADKSACPRCNGKLAFPKKCSRCEMVLCDMDCLDWHIEKDCQSGSAETGGEKAAPQKIADYFSSFFRELKPTAFRMIDGDTWIRFADAEKHAKDKVSNLHRAGIGEVWHWQGDEYDNLESLTCPVLISANDLRKLSRHPTFRQSPSSTEQGAEPVQPEKLNNAHKSGAASPELLPTQLPISKHSLTPEPLSTQLDTGKEK